MLNLSTMSLPDLRMDDGWMDGHIEIFINLFADKNFIMIDLLDFNVN